MTAPQLYSAKTSQRGGRMTKWKGQAASAAPAMLIATASALALTAGTARAEDITTPVAGPIALDAGEDHTITDTGSVTLMDVDAAAVAIDADYADAFVNDGLITVTGTGVAEGTGLLIDGALAAAGTIVNTGDIVMTATSDDALASATGIRVLGNADGTIDNAGVIETAINGATDASGAGIFVADDVQGMMINSGTINTVGTSDGDVAAYGILLEGLLDADFDNAGDISAQAAATDGTGTGIGVAIMGAVNGNLVNSGTIIGAATGTSSALGVGVRLADDMTGDFINSGTITASATDGTSSAEAYGLFLSGAFDGQMTNTGSIVTTAVNTAAGNASLFANGILITNTVVDGASLSNSGSISTTATNLGTASSLQAAGVQINTLAGTFSNEGTIIVDVSGAGLANQSSAYGLLVGELSGEITDVGTIAVNAPGAVNAYAIFLTSGDGTLNIDTDDSIDGLIGVSTQNVTLSANGTSNIFFFEDTDIGAGSFTTTVDEPGATWFVDGEGTQDLTYAAVVDADFDTTSTSAGDYGRLLEAISMPLAGRDIAAVTSSQMSFDDRNRTDGMRPFVSASAEKSEFDRDGRTNAADITLTNATFGFAGVLASGVQLSGGFGAFEGDGSSGPNDFESKGFYGGVAIGQTRGDYILDGGIGFGKLSTDNTRDVGGGDTTTASFDSRFATLHIGARRDVTIYRGADIQGFGNLRYTRQTNDGYAETGSILDATVAERRVGVTEAKLGAEATYAAGDRGRLTGALQITARRTSGDSDIDVTIFGDTAPLRATTADFTGLGLALGYAFAISDGGALTVDAAQEFGDGGQGPTISAGIRWSF